MKSMILVTVVVWLCSFYHLHGQVTNQFILNNDDILSSTVFLNSSKAYSSNCCDCPINRSFTNLTIPAGTYSVANEISTTNNVNIADLASVTFNAQTITLSNGFSASSANGSTFTAKVNPCTLSGLECADAGADQAICAGETATLSASGGTSYSWSNGQSGPNITVSPTVTTTYTVSVSDNGCESIDEVTVTVNTATPPAFTGGPSITAIPCYDEENLLDKLNARRSNGSRVVGVTGGVVVGSNSGQSYIIPGLTPNGSGGYQEIEAPSLYELSVSDWTSMSPDPSQTNICTIYERIFTVIDECGNGDTYSQIVFTIETSVNGDTETRNSFAVQSEETPTALTSQVDSLDIVVFPNPATKELTIEYYLPSDGAISIDLVNSEGKTVNTILKNSFRLQGKYQERLNLNNFSAGYYFIRVVNNDAVITQKVIISKN